MQFKDLNINVVFVTAVVVICLAGLVAFYSSDDNKNQFNQVHVSGECLKKVKKDKTSVVVEVKNLAPKSNDAMAKSNATYKRVSDYVSALQKDKKDVELDTLSYESYEKKEWNQKTKKYDLLGIESVIKLEITSADRELIGKLLNAVSVYSDIYPGNLKSFTSNELMKKEQEACIEEATLNAKEKAEKLVKTAGGKLGKMVNVNFSQNSGAGNVMYDEVAPVMYKAMAREVKNENAPVIYTKDREISVIVNASFEIK